MDRMSTIMVKPKRSEQKSSLLGASNIKVVLRHFYRHYLEQFTVVLVLEGLGFSYTRAR
jgi:hypothetical protein